MSLQIGIAYFFLRPVSLSEKSNQKHTIFVLKPYYPEKLKLNCHKIVTFASLIRQLTKKHIKK